jgi:lipopolysaccharide biosynthesis glycosyltransferase
MTNQISIALSTNDSYAEYALVLATSILENTTIPSDIHFYLCTREPHSTIYNKMKTLIAKYGAVVDELSIPQASYRGVPAKDYKSLDAYSRLFAPRLVGEEVERLIYLDLDTLVRVDIRSFWDIDLSGHTLGAVRDEYYEQQEGRSPLFNSGVLLIDVKRWKERKVEEQVLSEVRHGTGGIVALADQDDLNTVLHDDWQILDPSWNLMCSDILSGKIDYHEGKILHFNGGEIYKPDHILCIHPGKVEYFKYLKYSSTCLHPICFVPVWISKILLLFSLSALDVTIIAMSSQITIIQPSKKFNLSIYENFGPIGN